MDDINVFPVPDADTGTNLVATMGSAVRAVQDVADDETPRVAARAALRGAQGNAGTILSQVIAGLGQVLAEQGPLDDAGIAAAFERMRTLVLAAVDQPVEGTMVTAVQVAADAASRATSDPLEAVVEQVGHAVAATPDQLSELGRAGVVDAGAHGFEIVCHALRTTVTGRPADVPRRDAPGPSRRPDVSVNGPRYEVQYLVQGPSPDPDGLRAALDDLGDSVGVVEGDGVVRVHVHTDDTDRAVAAGTERGRVRQVEVTDLVAQVQDEPGDDPVPLSVRGG